MKKDAGTSSLLFPMRGHKQKQGVVSRLDFDLSST
jgi:hypothetical protein